MNLLAIEEQAINRVHRIGQSKSTYIYKYIIDNTIEERINNSQNRSLVTNSTKASDNARLTNNEIKYILNI